MQLFSLMEGRGRVSLVLCSGNIGLSDAMGLIYSDTAQSFYCGGSHWWKYQSVVVLIGGLTAEFDAVCGWKHCLVWCCGAFYENSWSVCCCGSRGKTSGDIVLSVIAA